MVLFVKAGLNKRALCNAKSLPDAIAQGSRRSKAHSTGTVNCNNL
jgi:hypothetical protein